MSLEIAVEAGSIGPKATPHEEVPIVPEIMRFERRAADQAAVHFAEHSLNALLQILRDRRSPNAGVACDTTDAREGIVLQFGKQAGPP